jgi:dipeptidyl aminopeptidase/acylaminoacyl peptidase
VAAVSDGVVGSVSVPSGRIVGVSPDGRWLAAEDQGGQFGARRLCVYDAATAAARSCADLPSVDPPLDLDNLSWSPDGNRLVFAPVAQPFTGDGDLAIFDAAAGRLRSMSEERGEGGVPAVAAAPTAWHDSAPAWSPDGRAIAFVRSGITLGAAATAIALLDPDDGSVRTVAAFPADAVQAVDGGLTWSADGARLFFATPVGEGGRAGVWVVAAAGGEPTLLLPADRDRGNAVLLAVAGNTGLALYPRAYALFQAPFFATVDLLVGAATPIGPSDMAAGEEVFLHLVALAPNGRALAIVEEVIGARNYVRLVLTDRDGANRRVVADDLPAFVPLGYARGLRWTTDGTIWIDREGTPATWTTVRLSAATRISGANEAVRRLRA